MKKIFITTLALVSIISACGKKNDGTAQKKSAKNFNSLPTTEAAIDDLKDSRWKAKNVSTDTILKIENSGDILTLEKGSLSTISNCTHGKFKLVAESDYYALKPTQCNLIINNVKYNQSMAIIKLENNKLKLLSPIKTTTNNQGITSTTEYLEYERID